MANLEQSRQDSLDSIQEKLNSMAADTPLDNTKRAIDSLDWDESKKEININEDFAEMCNILRNWNDTEKELAKLKLIVYLSQAGETIDYDKTDIVAIPDPQSPDRDLIILKYYYNEHVVDENTVGGEYTQYTLRNEWGKWYYWQGSGSFARSKID